MLTSKNYTWVEPEFKEEHRSYHRVTPHPFFFLAFFMLLVIMQTLFNWKIQFSRKAKQYHMSRTYADLNTICSHQMPTELEWQQAEHRIDGQCWKHHDASYKRPCISIQCTNFQLHFPACLIALLAQKHLRTEPKDNTNVQVQMICVIFILNLKKMTRKIWASLEDFTSHLPHSKAPCYSTAPQNQ